MNYIYDIYLNFNENLYDFFDWNKDDKLTRIKIIPIFKIDENELIKIINYNVKLDDNFFNNIQNKATTWNKLEKKKNYALFCDTHNVVAIEFDNYGKSIKKSTLFIDDELEIIETSYKLNKSKINFKTLNKINFTLKTRKQIKEETFIKDELKNIDNIKLNYIYFECFGKKELDRKKIIKKLLSLSKKSKEYKNLYNILKLTSTTIK